MADQVKQKQTLQDYFIRLQIATSCNVCGSEDWFVGNTGKEYTLADGRQIKPVEVVCNFCGRIVFYDGNVMGL
jgi:ribosomal protein S27E